MIAAAPAPAPAPVQVRIGGPLAVAPVPAGFVGLSIEYQSLGAEVGTPDAPNGILDQLLSGLEQGPHPSVRVGGDSADHTFVPAPGQRTNPGLSYALTPEWLTDVHGFAARTGARLLLGLNLEADDPALAGREATTLLRDLGRPAIDAWEVGNEPSLYAVFPWYTSHAGGRTVARFARPRRYSVDRYLAEVGALTRALPPVATAGPSLGPGRWLAQLPRIIGAQPRLGLVTYHGYPTNCYAAAGSTQAPTLGNLLSPSASVGFAAGLARYVEEAHAAHRPFRVDEMNSASCGGTSGVSDGFGSALWMTDALFALAERGVDGVNVHSFESARYRPFSFSRPGGEWQARVEADYYGMLQFSQAAPVGSRLLSASADRPGVEAFAARTPADSADAGALTVTLTNDSTSAAATVAVRLPGHPAAQLRRMLAPSPTATAAGGAITLAGQGFGSSTSSGTLSGPPVQTAVTPSGGRYTVTLPPASSAVLVVPR